jgi:hypothetical protein
MFLAKGRVRCNPNRRNSMNLLMNNGAKESKEKKLFEIVIYDLKKYGDTMGGLI